MAKQEKQRMIELGADEMWTDFLEASNDLFLEEKAARHNNDADRTAEICL